MNYTKTTIAALTLALGLGAGCSQGSREEAIDRVTEAAKTLNGKADKTPDIVKEQIKKEKERQNSQWTIENVTAHPVEACNAKIEEIEAKLSKAEVAFNRALSEKASAENAKSAADADAALYGEFLDKARPAYKTAKESGKWPIKVNGYSLGEEAAEDKILAALKKVEESKAKSERAAAKIANMDQRRKDVKRIIANLKDQREKVLEYRENIRSGQLQSEINGLVNVLNDGSVRISDLEAVNSTQGIDTSNDVFTPSQSAADRAALDKFLLGE